MFFFNRLIESLAIENAFVVLCLNRSDARCWNSLRIKLCHMQKTLCNAAAREWNNQNTGALTARTTGTA